MERQRHRIDGARVRSYRERRGVDGNEFAAIIGISQASLSNIERGKRGASPRLILVIARELGVGFDDITIDTMKVPLAS
jgi:transcriptional regulator with XRE-family HTH domain